MESTSLTHVHITETILGSTRGYHMLLNTILINMHRYKEKLLVTSHLLLSSTYFFKIF